MSENYKHLQDVLQSHIAEYGCVISRFKSLAKDSSVLRAVREIINYFVLYGQPDHCQLFRLRFGRESHHVLGKTPAIESFEVPMLFGIGLLDMLCP
jgi:hypothetical protein